MSQTKTAKHETEKELIQRAQTAVSQWGTKKFARGRTDADFGELVGMSGDQVYQRRRVCETFTDVRDNYSALKWSHFYIALNWDDAAECLSWANENEATIAEMKAWRRLQRGEDVTTSATEDQEALLVGNDGAAAFDAYDSDRPGVVRAEGDLDLPASRAPMPAGSAKRGRETSDAATLSASSGEYTLHFAPEPRLRPVKRWTTFRETFRPPALSKQSSEWWRCWNAARNRSLRMCSGSFRNFPNESAFASPPR